jgi:hypothetical protein
MMRYMQCSLICFRVPGALARREVVRCRRYLSSVWSQGIRWLADAARARTLFVRCRTVAQSGALYHFPKLAMANAKETSSPPENQKPVKVFRLRGISASVFANQAKTGERTVTFYKVSLQRTYKDGDDFKTTTSFSRDDLPVCMHVLQQAWVFILETESKRNSADSE